MSDNPIVIEAMCERVTFHNAQSLYTVLRMLPLRGGGKEIFTAVGRFVEPQVGTRYALTGRWVEHKEYGRQFSFDLYEELLPTSRHGIERFLSSGLIKGIGEGLARRLVDAFGEDTLTIVEAQPERLGEVKGLTPRKQQALIDGLAKHRELKHVMSFLSSYDITPGLILRIYKHYGTACIEVVRRNPYQLCEDVWGVGFKTADMVARKMGMPDDAPERARAGLQHVLAEAQDNGHLYLPRPGLLAKASETLGIAEEKLVPSLEGLLLENRFVDDDDAIYLTRIWDLECRVAERVARMLTLPPLPCPDHEAEGLAPLQQKARLETFASGIFVMSGGPGTGKTTTVRSILSWAREKGMKVRLAAPTGRAAKRLAEATGEDASTVHRLLEWSVQTNQFLKGPHDPLDIDMLIVDEASMLDIFLIDAVLAGLPPNGHLLLVGDADQLPSVGPGQVLADLINSSCVPTVHLTEIFRQGAGSRIIENSHRINHGLMPETPREGASDFYFVREQEPDGILDRIVEYACTRIPNGMKLDPIQDLQVLSPMYRGQCGIDKLNERLQERLNPDGRKIEGLGFRVGDKVMQLRNNYEKGAFNGDIGIVVDVDVEERTFFVQFPGPEAEPMQRPYEYHEAGELTLAYACSVHKSQGSEFPAVVMPIVTQHYPMLQRNLLYTAVSRARKLLVLVGQPKALQIAVGNNAVVQRHTRLAERVADLSPAAPAST